ncbi:hypothetical protein BCR41DRAFT_200775 [Lobosporangium transversale]|uniref:Uncharacterized protein n=1 Tax=Lobosporangium transversale TaxID=64571 RepID=A0A1Y2G9V6_9FUNG|nr:hypothetical protein BCR41DRAFT_200666 [Lobosporangium transversale]XP_021876427.1 hypothetical protein BCR41DRAFT_200775 [Lobosporangium transversale]ORZ04212.1 hypothetical protein BCR41DRAFT_200666 [Lobosporangium transversale]ORZ04213.1 hypothetical protein BCR41DRAFT_200775 [Lobosporangium transversale]|eukprot:XP_021876426.1 hypothetical protein BCR41DRAFT_200666 [Lobosporangium transversale]
MGLRGKKAKGSVNGMMMTYYASLQWQYCLALRSLQRSSHRMAWVHTIKCGVSDFTEMCMCATCYHRERGESNRKVKPIMMLCRTGTGRERQGQTILGKGKSKKKFSARCTVHRRRKHTNMHLIYQVRLSHRGNKMIERNRFTGRIVSH